MDIPDLLVEMVPVPASHRDAVGADLACRHIADKGTDAFPEFHVLHAVNKKHETMAACKECRDNFDKMAKRGPIQRRKHRYDS
jgi:hypothetical protein